MEDEYRDVEPGAPGDEIRLDVASDQVEKSASFAVDPEDAPPEEDVLPLPKKKTDILPCSKEGILGPATTVKATDEDKSGTTRTLQPFTSRYRVGLGVFVVVGLGAFVERLPCFVPLTTCRWLGQKAEWVAVCHDKSLFDEWNDRIEEKQLNCDMGPDLYQLTLSDSRECAISIWQPIHLRSSIEVEINPDDTTRRSSFVVSIDDSSTNAKVQETIRSALARYLEGKGGQASDLGTSIDSLCFLLPDIDLPQIPLSATKRLCVTPTE